MIIRREKNKNYSIISNECLKNAKISTRAKGMYAYIMTLPDDWVIQKGELYKHFAEGKDYLDKGFNELKKYGYIQQIRVQKENGQFAGYEYVVYEFAQNTSDETISGNSNNGEKPLTDLPLTEYPLTVKPHLLKTNKKQNTERKLITKLPKNIVSEDSDHTGEPNQLVSSSSPFLVKESKPTNSTQEDEVKEDLESIGLSRSQIIALLRVHDILILENAVTETYQAQYEQRITEKASQYFYGTLKKMQVQRGDD